MAEPTSCLLARTARNDDFSSQDCSLIFRIIVGCIAIGAALLATTNIILYLVLFNNGDRHLF